MKKRTLRILAAIVAAILLVSIIAGCSRNTDDPNEIETPEFVFVPEVIQLPEGITDMQNLVYSDGKLYFTSFLMDEENYSYNTMLFSMDIDGTNMKALENYSGGDMPEGAMGQFFINAMRIDRDGNIWVVENGNFYGFELPEGVDLDEARESGEMWQYYYDLGNIMAVRKLDSTGRELLTVDISSLASDTEWFYIRTFSIDSYDNIYLATDQTIYVMTNDGRLQFRLEVQNWIDQLLTMSDGTVAFSGYMESGRALRTIDFVARTWGEDIPLPFNAGNIFPGGGEYSLVYTDNSNLFGISTETGETVKLLNWINSDIRNDGLGNITILPDGRVMCTNQRWNQSSGEVTFELIILTQVPYDTLPPRTILTLATVWLDWTLRNAIVDFNRTNTTYRIQVNDYSEFNTEDDWNAGLTRLTTEMISGRIPDMLDLQGLPYQQYVARGLLEDLYKFIDNDPTMSRRDLMEDIFRATEMNGGLYQIFTNFYIQTVVGHPSVLGPGMGWNMDEFAAVLRANPQAEYPMGFGITRASFLSDAVSISIDEYVDWARGMCYFDRGDFAQLLEFANTFPEEFDWSSMREDMMYRDPFEMIANGQQLMMSMGISDFRSIQMYRAVFGGDIVFKGFPTASRNGNALSVYSGIGMTSRCRDKEGAWTFMRTILTEEWQNANVTWGLPTNKAAFDEKLVEAMTPQYYIDEDGNEVEISMGGWGWGSMVLDWYAMTQQEADQLMELINSVSGVRFYEESLMNIINEGAADYFAGRSSAQDAARIIQSRASIFIAEQS